MTQQTPELPPFNEEYYLRIVELEAATATRRKFIDYALRGAVIRDGLSGIAGPDSDDELSITVATLDGQTADTNPAKGKIIDVIDKSDGAEVVDVRKL